MRDDVKHQAKVYHQAIQIQNDFIYYMYYTFYTLYAREIHATVFGSDVLAKIILQCKKVNKSFHFSLFAFRRE